MWGNTVAIHSVLKRKTTKLNSQPAQYEKNKIDKDNSGKKKQKKSLKNEKKNHVEKHCSNPQCFKEKKLQSHIKKIKSTKTILKKKNTKN